MACKAAITFQMSRVCTYTCFSTKKKFRNAYRRYVKLKVFIDQNKLITNHDRVFKAISRSYYSIISGCNIIDSSQAN